MAVRNISPFLVPPKSSVTNLKFEPCAKCGGVQAGFGLQRSIFWLTDVVKIRCNNCGDIVTLEKNPPVTSCEAEGEDLPFGCGSEPTVSDLASERSYCAKHFREVCHV